MERIITLLPVGEVESDLMLWLCRPLRKFFKAGVNIYAVMKFPRDAFNPVRGQYFAALIISRIRRCLSPGEQERILGVTEKDIYADELKFIFGKAEMPGQFALISLARLRPSFYGYYEKKNLIRQRMLKEAVHELGHTWGLGHCSNPACAMHFSFSLKDTDNKEHSFCDSCRKKWQNASGGE
ncbi:MAG: archaemetzincin family Zn-dependent metalloprotease [Candidatus Aminicenantes bacterium]